MRNRSRWVLWAAVVAVIAAGGIAAAVRDTPEASTQFIADSEGQSIVAHGFSTAGSAKSSVDNLPIFTEADLDREQADMGTNFVRFLIFWSAIEPERGVIDEAYLDGVEERVQWYADRGYHVMLDMHQDLWGPSIIPDVPGWANGAPEWATFSDGLPVAEQDMWELVYLEPGTIRAFDHFWNTTGEHPELRTHYTNAWKAVAERFADNDAVVAYDLMNEPYGGTLQGPAFESGPLTDLYQQVADGIREVDQDTWLCVEPQAFGFNWGVPTSLGAIDDARDGDDRVAFCPHLYPLPMDLGDGFAGDSKPLVEGTVSQWNRNVLSAAARLGKGDGAVPIILGEFGLDTSRVGAEEYVRLVYATADAGGMGVAYWSRDNGGWGPYEADGTTPRNLVDWLARPYARAVEHLISWQIDGGTMTFEVADAGTAEVQVAPGGPAAEPVVDGADVVSWDAVSGVLELRTRGAGTVTVTR